MESELEILYKYWFKNPRLWFNCSKSDDKEISDLFLDIYERREELKTNSIKDCIGKIILYDQIVRHLVRVKNNVLESNVDKNLIQILNFSYNFYVKNADKLNAHEFCFVLLPLRHTFLFKNYEFILKETWKKINLCEIDEDKMIYKKFLQATYRKCPSKPIYTFLDKEIKNEHINIKYIYDTYQHILDKKSIYKEKLNDGIHDLDCGILNKKKNLIISISGGVDSMVLSFLLKKKTNNNIVLVHINYNNRDSCNDEVDLLYKWALLLNVEIFVRNIYEINRLDCKNNNLRELYETYTQQVRYEFYRNVANKLGWNNEYYIVLGHNNDDCVENILTNISKKQKYENLYGMSEYSQIDDLHFYRPFLQIPKKEIYLYANLENIPYLYDSTPSWSQRGQIRDNVVPVIQQWNDSFIHGLDELNSIMRDNYELLNILVDNLMKNISKIKSFDETKYEFMYKINLENKIMKNKMFWTILFRKIDISISNKSLNNLLEKINDNKRHNIELSKYYKMIIERENLVYICKKTII